MVINLCTVSDTKYLNQGLVLYESLINKNSNIKLHYLCLDNESYVRIKKYENPNLIIYSIIELISADGKLKNLYENNYKYFCWAMASYFSNYLLNKSIDSITYIDSDIYFHQNIDSIISSIGGREVGIFRHRQFPLNIDRAEGWYNVGVVYFKNTELGKKVLDWWCDAVINQKYPELATCGDQKYLNEFPNMCPPDKIFIDGEIGHGAPWQWQLYDYSSYESDGSIIWNGVKQKLIFTHFSQFTYDIEHDVYMPTTMHFEYTRLPEYVRIDVLKSIYDSYFEEIKRVNKKYKL